MWKKTTNDPKKKSIADDSEQDTITEDSERTLKRIL